MPSNTPAPSSSAFRTTNFHADRVGRHKVAKASEALRGALRKVGRMGDGISHIRDALLGL